MTNQIPSRFPAFYSYSQALTPIPDTVWANLERCLSMRNFRKGDLLIKPGEICSYVSFILSGKARMYFITGEKEVIISAFFENEYVTDYDSFLTRKPSRTYIRFMDDTAVVELSYADVQDLYEKHPVLQRYGRLIAEHLYMRLSETIASVMLDDPETRYAKLQQENPRLLNEFPQYMVASILGITPEALSRLRRRMFKKST